MIGVLLTVAIAGDPAWMRPSWDASSGQLEIAARAWQASPQGPTVWLVGVSHLGEPEYYREIRALLDGCDVVVFESVLPEAAQPPGGDDDAARAETTRSTAELIARTLGGVEVVDWNQAIERAGQTNTPAVSIIRSLPRDGWGRPWILTADHIISRGADGRAGGDAAAADIVIELPEAVGDDDGGSLQRTMAESLGLAFQLDALPYADRRWVPGDMRIDEVVAAFEVRGQGADGMLSLLSEDGFFGGLLSGMMEMIPLIDSLFGGRVVDTFRVLMIEMLGNEELVHGTLDMQAPAIREVLIDLRNERAMEVLHAELDALGAGESIALLYGAGHLPGLVALLEADDAWVVSDERWLPAITLDLETSPLSAAEVKMLRGWIGTFGSQMLR
ncbi:MAG: hypothetical protein QF733_00775 [Phycisphaerales bacterium]|jgi:hypothetical protein|nr:hypothetical protein [Phycisphaerales bacterium]